MLTHTAPVKWFTNNLEYWKWKVIASDESLEGRMVQVIESPLNSSQLVLDETEYQRDPSSAQERIRAWGNACAQEKGLRDKDPLRGLSKPLAWLRQQRREQSRKVADSAGWYSAANAIGLDTTGIVIRRSPDKLRTVLTTKSTAVLTIERFECERMNVETEEVETVYLAEWVLLLIFSGLDSRYNSAFVRVTKESYSLLVQHIVDAAQMVRQGTATTVNLSREFGQNVRAVLDPGYEHVEIGGRSSTGYQWSDRLSSKDAEALAREISELPETVRALLAQLQSPSSEDSGLPETIMLRPD